MDNLRSGTRSTWQGGLDRPGWQFSIPSLSWAGGGRTLAYLAQWCPVGPLNSQLNVCPSAAPRQPAPLVREITVTGDGGRLDSGSVLLRGSARYPEFLQVQGLPNGRLLALVQRGPTAYLVSFSVPGGRSAQVLYQRNDVHGVVTAELSTDSTARYSLLNVAVSAPIYEWQYGWVSGGRFHQMGGYVMGLKFLSNPVDNPGPGKQNPPVQTSAW